MSTGELLVELYSEEIPWRLQKPLAEKLRDTLEQHLRQELDLRKAESLGESRVFSTPRRVASSFGQVPLGRRAWVEERKGPRVGSPEEAIKGFLRANNVDSLEECKRVESTKGAYWVVEVRHSRQSTTDCFARLVPRILNELRQTLPVSMRFADQEFRWIRPLRHVLVIFHGKKVKGTIDMGNGESLPFTDQTRGHVFANNSAFKVSSVEQYERELEKRHVIADADKRVASLTAQIAHMKRKNGLDILGNEEICTEENSALVEFPTILQGKFDAKFLSLPNFLIETVLYQHQKIYPTSSHVFFAVCNNPEKEYHTDIIKGYERVVRARLSDAKFMYDKDRQISLFEHSKKLQHIAFHPRLGTMADKINRVKELMASAAKIFCPEDWCFKAIELMRADLATETVREFPQLQGKVGGELCGTDEGIRHVIEEQYNYSVSFQYLLAAYVLFSDRIDTLVSLWLAGEKPTGSGDPFALRRQAIPILNFTNVGNKPLPLRSFFELAIAEVKKQFPFVETKNALEEILEFLLTRLRVQITKGGVWRMDCAEAILLHKSAMDVQECDIYNLRERIESLDIQLKQNNPLVEIFYRLDSLLPSSLKREKKVIPTNPSLLKQKEEKELYRLIADDYYLYPLPEEDFWLNFRGRLVRLGELKPYMDEFFDNILVMHEDSAIRENRLNLLHFFYRHFLSLADFTKIHHKDRQQKGQAHGQAKG